MNCEKPNGWALQRIIDLNVQGIESMKDHCFRGAIAYFHEGMETLLESFLDDDPDRRSGVCSQENISVTNAGAKRLLAGEELLHSTTLFDESLSFSYDDTFILFKRALFVGGSSDIITRRPGLFCRLMSAVLLFNVGLAHHILGLDECEAAEVNNALEYYSMAYTTLLNQLAHLDGSTGVLDLAFLALVNNMAHAFAYFRNYSRAGMCRQELSRLLTSFVSGNEGTAAPVSSSSEYSSFFMNAYLLEGTEVISAPAA